MVGWPHQLEGHESEKVLGTGDGQGSLACPSPGELPAPGIKPGFSAIVGGFFTI